jgi:hypothetical protein
VYRELAKTQRLPAKKHGAKASKLDTRKTSLKEKCPQLIGPIDQSGRRYIMPKVGNKKYAYTKAGKAAAAKARMKKKKSKGSKR